MTQKQHFLRRASELEKLARILPPRQRVEALELAQERRQQAEQAEIVKQTLDSLNP